MFNNFKETGFLIQIRYPVEQTDFQVVNMFSWRFSERFALLQVLLVLGTRTSPPPSHFK
jgi:hypothetical protein